MRDFTLITGGAGFIGSNYASRCLERGDAIKIYDNLSRAGSMANLAWLEETYGIGSFELIKGDVRDADAINQAAKGSKANSAFGCTGRGYNISHRPENRFFH